MTDIPTNRILARDYLKAYTRAPDMSGNQTAETKNDILDLNDAVNCWPGATVTVDFESSYYKFDDASIDFSSGSSALMLFARGGVILDTRGSIFDGTELPYDESRTAAIVAFVPDEGAAVTSAVTASLTKNSTYVPVSSASGFNAGDWIEIVSNEYHSGLPGVDGYGIKTKGEIAQISAISGNNLYVYRGLADDYLLTGGLYIDDGATGSTTSTCTLQVQTINMGAACDVTGGLFLGTNNGANVSDMDQPETPRAINMVRIVGGRITDAEFRGFTRFVGLAEECVDITVSNCHFIGRDYAVPSNQGISQSKWFEGFDFQSCQGVNFSGNVGRGLRHLMDTNSDSVIGGTVICRNITVTGNTFEDCENVRVHCCENIVFSGNVAIRSGGFGSRGKHMTFVGNRSYATLAAEAGFRGGGAANAAYTLPTSCGHVNSSGNYIEGNSPGWAISADCDSFTSTGDTFVITGGHGYAILNQKCGSIVIDACNIDLSGRGSAQYCGIYAESGTSGGVNQRVLLDGLKITDSVIKNAYIGVAVEGTLQVSQIADNIALNGIRFVNSEFRDIRFGNFNGAAGYLGSHITVSNCDMSQATATAISLDAGRYFARSPKIYDNTYSDFSNGIISTGSAVPNVLGMNYFVGDRVRIHPPVASGYSEYVCTADGTGGSLTRSGAMTSGSAVLVLATTASLRPGMILRVAGAGASGTTLVSKVVSENSDNVTITLSDMAGTTVSGANVSFQAPVWKGTSQNAA